MTRKDILAFVCVVIAIACCLNAIRLYFDSTAAGRNYHSTEDKTEKKMYEKQEFLKFVFAIGWGFLALVFYASFLWLSPSSPLTPSASSESSGSPGPVDLSGSSVPVESSGSAQASEYYL